MKRLIPLALAIGALAALPAVADAARSCGNIDSPDGRTWQIATVKAPCGVARDVGQRYINFQTSTDFRSRRVIIKRKWGCGSGASVAGYCERGRQGVWILTQVGKPVDHLRVYPPRLFSAEYIFRGVLREKFGRTFTFGISRKVKCRKVNRLRQKCVAAWGLGDSTYKVRARVRLIPHDPFDVTRVAGTATRLNNYCFSVLNRPLNRCLHRHRFGPVTH